jgi:hypothetical protein
MSKTSCKQHVDVAFVERCRSTGMTMPNRVVGVIVDGREVTGRIVGGKGEHRLGLALELVLMREFVLIVVETPRGSFLAFERPDELAREGLGLILEKARAR